MMFFTVDKGYYYHYDERLVLLDKFVNEFNNSTTFITST